jgi:hypothetical protein
MTTNEETWEHTRRVKWSKFPPPSNWPAGVRPISQTGLALLGINERTGRLYWDGTELATKVGLKTFERVLATIATGAAVGGFILSLGSTMGWWD